MLNQVRSAVGFVHEEALKTMLLQYLVLGAAQNTGGCELEFPAQHLHEIPGAGVTCVQTGDRLCSSFAHAQEG